MARSFYEMFHKPVKAFAQRELAPTRFTKIVDLELIDGFAEDPVWVRPSNLTSNQAILLAGFKATG